MIAQSIISVRLPNHLKTVSENIYPETPSPLTTQILLNIKPQSTLVLNLTKAHFHRSTMEQSEINTTVKFDKQHVLNDKLSFQSKYIYETAIKVVEEEGDII